MFRRIAPSTFISILLALSLGSTALGQNIHNRKKSWSELSKLVSDQPTSAVRWLDKADAEANALEDQSALEDYNMAIKLEPGYAQAYLRRGDCYRHLGNFEKANADYQKTFDLAIAYKTDQRADLGREAADRLSNDFRTKGQEIAALKFYDQLVKRFNTPKDQCKKGQCEYALGRYEDASRDLATGLKGYTADPEVMGAYADCLMKQKKYAEANAQYTKVIDYIRKKDKNFTTKHRYEFLQSRARAEKELGQSDAAAKDDAEARSIRDGIFDLVPFREPITVKDKKPSKP